MCEQVLYPELNALLALEDWRKWDEALQRICYDEAEMASFLEQHAVRKAQLEDKRAARRTADEHGGSAAPAAV